jgi:hypothetical protein
MRNMTSRLMQCLMRWMEVQVEYPTSRTQDVAVLHAIAEVVRGMSSPEQIERWSFATNHDAMVQLFRELVKAYEA